MKYLLMLALFLGLSPKVSAAEPVVVAVANGKSIHIGDVLARKNMIPELQNVPLEQVFEGLRDQLVAEVLIEKEVSTSGLENDPEVKKAAERCVEAAKAKIFIERQLEKMVTDEDLMALFKELMKGFKKQKEIRAHHILVPSEAEAKEIIGKLEKGSDFAELAKKHSQDQTSKERGGDLGYFISKDQAKEIAGPEFAEALITLKPGSFGRKPIKSSFGYHVLKPVESRMSKPPKFEEAAPQLRLMKTQEALLKYIEGLKSKLKVKIFDMLGKPAESKDMSSKK